MKYAIMRSRRTDLLKTVNLNMYDEYDWENLWLIRSIKNKEVVLFESEEKAHTFMVKNFDVRMIEPVYVEIKDNNGQYYLG